MALPSTDTEGLCPRCLFAQLDQLEESSSSDGLEPEAKSSSADPAPNREGGEFGDYELLEEIGQGGMGVVYRARQLSLNRPAAVKVIKLGMDTKQVIARFEAERRALAVMDHPNIAKVFDAGVTDTGRPYFVMELVQGIKITDYCDRHRLATRQRLELFIQVCHAVQHAHQKGIIHRDLKPSNIIVPELDGRPVPKIIDFGIAKAVEGRLTDQTLFTACEQFLGTPAYMSPEQATLTAVDIDTRSDIYSLGVLLYELLTGETPFDTKALLASGIDELRRTIRDVNPVRPSTRLTQLLVAADVRGLASKSEIRSPKSEIDKASSHRLLHIKETISHVRGDLDWVVMKCLEKERQRRYETANGLAMDLQRHLDNEPVLARPPSRLYEFQKMFRRHKVGFAAAAAVIIVLAAGVLVTSREAVRARRAEQETRHTAYIADMNLANRALDENDLGTARRLLSRYWPGPQETDLRNWEWRYLANLSAGDPHVSLVAHSAGVRSLCFLDDNALLTAASADWRTVVWNLKERRPSNIITNRNFGGGGGVSEVAAVARRRNMLFSRSQWTRDSVVTVINLQTGQESRLRDANRTRLDRGAPTTSLDISPDQNVLAVAFANHVALWDLDRKTWSQPFETESGAATQGLFSPDGRVLVVADAAGYIAFWNLADRKKLGVLTNAPGSLGVLRFSADGRWLVNPGGKLPTRVWNAQDRSLVAELPDSAFVERAVFSTDGRWLATVGGDTTVRLWETARWHKARTLRGHADPVFTVDFSPNGKFLATGARNGEVKLWPMDEPPTAPEQVSLPTSENFQSAGDGSGFGRILRPSNGIASWTGEVWTTTPLQRSFTVALPAGPPSSAVVLAGSRGAVLGGYDGIIRVVGPLVGHKIMVTNAHKKEVYIMDASLDGSTLATKELVYTDDARVRIWRLPRLEPISELPHAQNVHGFKLSDDGKWLAFFTGPGDMGVWEVPSMKGPPMWRGVAALQNVVARAFSPDNRWLAAATSDGGAFLWDLATQRRMALPRALTAYTSLSFSPDGSRLAAGSEGESKLFDVASGQVVLSFKQHGLNLAFARDGERLLAVHGTGAFVFHAPALKKLQFDWLKERPSQEAPPYLGPRPDYPRPDRP